MSAAPYKVPSFRSSGIGGAGNFVKNTKPVVIEDVAAQSRRQSTFIMRGIGGAGNAISRSKAEAQPRASTSSERPLSLRSVTSGRYHGIGGRGNWSWYEKRRDSIDRDEKRRGSTESDSSLI